MISLWLALSAWAAPPQAIVLGVAQDAGHPQAGCDKSCCTTAWQGEGHAVASLGLFDPDTGQVWLIDATPDLPRQLRQLDEAAQRPSRQLDGVFLTHAHIGHYTGLMHLGREAMGTRSVPVWAMPRMASFLTDNGPWSQLVSLHNIVVEPLAAGVSTRLSPDLTVTPLLVPHRDELSETVGFVVQGPSRALLWLPDIDKWERWERALIDVVAQVDVAFVDGTFFADGELPGRAMADIPHPFVAETLERARSWPAAERAKLHFVHLNHTNPALDPTSEAAQQVRDAGAHMAEQGQRIEL